MFSSIAKKMIVAVTGAMLGTFILVHLAGNATIFAGGAAFLSYAEHLHSLGPFLRIAEVVLLAAFTLHVLFAGSLYFENLNARPDSYSVHRNNGGRTIGSMTMPYSGVIIAVFIGIHLATLSFSGDEMTVLELLKGYLGQPVMVILYVFALMALTLHISHGFWSMFQTMGINHPRYERVVIRNTTLLIALMTGIVFILIPIFVYFKGIAN